MSKIEESRIRDDVWAGMTLGFTFRGLCQLLGMDAPRVRSWIREVYQ